jgi:predicted secreted protein
MPIYSVYFFHRSLNALILIAIGAMFIWAKPAFSQQIRMETPQNLVTLTAQGSMQVEQDWLSISLSTTREGTNAAQVQSQLKAALDAALSEAKKQVQTGQLEVRTGAFGLYPRYGREGNINGWQGSAELLIEGRDLARISAVAGKINTLTLGQVSFSLSREARASVEAQVTAQAIERFKAKAQEISQGFGFSSYTLREVSIHNQDPHFAGSPRMARMQVRSSAEADAPVPTEAGRSTVEVTVSGSVQLK